MADDRRIGYPRSSRLFGTKTPAFLIRSQSKIAYSPKPWFSLSSHVHCKFVSGTDVSCITKHIGEIAGALNAFFGARGGEIGVKEPKVAIATAHNRQSFRAKVSYCQLPGRIRLWCFLLNVYAGDAEVRGGAIATLARHRAQYDTFLRRLAVRLLKWALRPNRQPQFHVSDHPRRDQDRSAER
jgi:hypothetical protein